MSSESVYAKPVAPRIIVRPALASLFLHGLLVAALTLNWVNAEPEVMKVKPVPKVINARLVDVSEFQKPQPKPKPKAASRPSVQPKPKPKPVAVKPRPKPVTPKATPAPKPKPEPAVKPEPEPRITEQELAAITRADMLRSLEAEESALEATATAEEMAASYAALIRQTVVNYWSRPPSARNGMQVLLEVQLVPTGEVVNVRVLEGSGNQAFDRSAMNAVKKAGSFPELSALPSREFEKMFRRFNLLFNPEDLRY